MEQRELFTAGGVALPDKWALVRRFAAFNNWYFNDTLPRARLRWSNRMRIAGSCDYQRHIITLSRPYHEHFPNDVDDTLKHEMIHLVCHQHDSAFRREAVRIGASVHCKEYPGLHPKARIVYMCVGCGALFHRVKKERLFCGRCSRGQLDTRFELVLRPPISNFAARRSRRTPIRTRPRGRHETFAASDLFG